MPASPQKAARCASCRQPLGEVGIVQIDSKGWHADCFPKTGPLARLETPKDVAAEREATIVRDLDNAVAAIRKQSPRKHDAWRLMDVGGNIVAVPVPFKWVLRDGAPTLTSGSNDVDRTARLLRWDVDRVDRVVPEDLKRALARREADRSAIADDAPLPRLGEGLRARDAARIARERNAIERAGIVEAEHDLLEKTNGRHWRTLKKSRRARDIKKSLGAKDVPTLSLDRIARIIPR